MDLEDYANLVYMFMTGVPGWGSSGFCMMGPEELKKQRWTYVKYWANLLVKQRSEAISALS